MFAANSLLAMVSDTQCPEQYPPAEKLNNQPEGAFGQV